MKTIGLSLPGYDVEGAPAEVLDYPGMTSVREKGMLFWLAKTCYGGDGLIVDAGLFLGASTNAFASGIKAGPVAAKVGRSGFKPLNSYDLAIWVGSMNRYLEKESVKKALKGRSPRRGQSYLPILEELLAHHRDLIDFRIGDIVELASADRPIEIAFYDCLKTGERDSAAFKAFAPHFIPGKTIVIQQDYFYESAPDLKIRQEFLAPYFSYLGGEASSAVFRLEKALPETYFRDDPVPALSIEKKVDFLLQAADRTEEPRFRLYARLSAVDFLAEHGMRDRARLLLSEVLGDAPARPEEMFGRRMATVLTALRDRLA